MPCKSVVSTETYIASSFSCSGEPKETPCFVLCACCAFSLWVVFVFLSVAFSKALRDSIFVG